MSFGEDEREIPDRSHSNPKCPKKDCRYATFVTCSQEYKDWNKCPSYYTDKDCSFPNFNN